MPRNLNKLGLALSGGGYRGAAFHLGTMRKLLELGILDTINVISTISGGSITGAYYCLHKKSFAEFETDMKKILSTKSVLKFIFTSVIFYRTVLFVLIFLAIIVYVLFTRVFWLSPILLILMVILFVIFQFKLFPVSRVIEKAYDQFFYNNARLSDLLENKPVLAIGSTNIQTSRPFTFSRTRMDDSYYSNLTPPVLFNSENFPLSRAVMASSSVPFAFTPVTIATEYYRDIKQAKNFIPVLVDGGVYDNQGLHKLTQNKSSYECESIIVSDAGNKLPFEKSYNNLVVLLVRVMNVFMTRIKNFQMISNLYKNTQYANRQIAFISLGWDIEICIPGFIDNLADKQIASSIIEAHKIPEDWVNDVKQYRSEIKDLLENNVNYKKILAEKLTEKRLTIACNVGTNLSALSMEEINCLADHAANITELQIKLYCPSLIK